MSEPVFYRETWVTEKIRDLEIKYLSNIYAEYE